MGSSLSTQGNPENIHDNIESLADRLNHLIDQDPWRMSDMLKIIGILGESTPDEKLALFNAGIVEKICKLIRENNNIEGVQMRQETAMTKRKRQNHSSPTTKDTGGTRGIGYGRGSTKSVWDIERTVEERIAQEEHLMWLICSLTAFLWGDALKLSEVNADFLTTRQAVHLVEDSLLPMIIDTSIFPLLEYHLNNDSIFDVSQHLDFYQALIELTAGLALIPSFLPYLVGPKDHESKSIAKELIPKFRDSLNNYMNNEKLPVSPDFTLVDFIQRINDLAELVLKCARKYEGDLPPEKRVKTAHPSTRRSVSLNSEDPSNLTKSDLYKNALIDLQVLSFKLIDDQGVPIFSNNFKKDLKNINPVSTSNRERNRRIAKELATLTSSLPLTYGSSIFVCMDESRVDLMKVLITGPEDTPYANGIFEFDVFFPSNYPNVPPKCQFLTTGNGTVRFNPNLYADGKVCLSILGTWEGRPEEKWNPLCSALQVLISIQALILVKFPYFNEPGFERQQGTSRGDEASRKYNMNIEQATLVHALYEQMRHPPPYFKDVVLRHIWLKRDDIIKQAENWLILNKNVSSMAESPDFEATPMSLTAGGETPIRRLIAELKGMPRPLPSDLISKEVKEALKKGKPVVALESTVITHGLPFPNNLETGKLLENEIRKKAAIPATIALMNGKVKIGLSEDELEKISRPGNKSVKASARDLANVLEKKWIGGTTVAATMRLAHLAGIRVFATGGIGGVHRGAEQTFDVSADLTELGKTPVAVVCAGAKSILDVPKTLEFLETQSCNVIVHGKEPWFPGFFTKKTNQKAPFWTDNLKEIADILVKQDELGLGIGTLVACPPPTDEGEKIESIIQKAVEECRERKIESKEVTPFILARVNELTAGKSMEINIALLRNNARIAADLSTLYAEAKSRKSVFTTPVVTPIYARTHTPNPTQLRKKPKVLSVGAAIVDLEVITDEDVKDDGGSYKGTIIQRCGGVGRNHAEAMGRLGCEVIFLTSVGDDEISQFLFKKAEHYDLSHAKIVKSVPTATYLSVNVKGTVVHGFSAIEGVVVHITPEYIKEKESLFENKDFVVIDGNLTVEAIDTVITLANQHGVKIWFDPADIAKADKILYKENYKKINVMSPNFNEMIQYIKAFEPESSSSSYSNFSSQEMNPELLTKTPVFKVAEKILSKMKSEDAQFFVTLGPLGTLAFEKRNSRISYKVVPSPLVGDARRVVSVSGAGDLFNSGFLTAKLYGKSFEESIDAGIVCARESLLHVEAVPETLNPKLIGIE